MKIKPIFTFLIMVLFVANQANAQVPRQSAKFMDTCTISLYAPDTIYLERINDSTNQIKIIRNCNFKRYQISFYNRFGTLVFQSTNANAVIDYKKFKKGTYFYILLVIHPNRKEEKKTGVITFY